MEQCTSDVHSKQIFKQILSCRPSSSAACKGCEALRDTEFCHPTVKPVALHVQALIAITINNPKKSTAVFIAGTFAATLKTAQMLDQGQNLSKQQSYIFQEYLGLLNRKSERSLSMWSKQSVRGTCHFCACVTWLDFSLEAIQYSITSDCIEIQDGSSTLIHLLFTHE